MKQVVDHITVTELMSMAQAMYGNLVKAVVDVKRSLLVVDVEMHVDAEHWLLEDGSQQSDLWGINLYPDQFGTAAFIEFDSVINIKPRQHNMSRGVDDTNLQEQIRAVVQQRVQQ